MKVFKYVEPLNDVVTFRLPEGAKMLRVDVQDERTSTVCLWALVDTRASAHEDRHIRIAGTGHEITLPANLVYINTFTMHDRVLWFHAFELI